MRPHIIPVREVSTGREAIELARAVIARRAQMDREAAELGRRDEQDRAKRRERIISLVRNITAEFNARTGRCGGVERGKDVERYSDSRISSEISELIGGLRDGSKAQFAAYIIAWASRKYRVPVSVITGKSRTKNVIAARFRAIQMIKYHQKTRDMTLDRIGMLFGGRDHGTIYEAIAKSKASARFSSIYGRNGGVTETIAALKMRLSGMSWDDIACTLGGTTRKWHCRIRKAFSMPDEPDAIAVTTAIGKSLDEIEEELKAVSRINLALSGCPRKKS